MPRYAIDVRLVATAELEAGDPEEALATFANEFGTGGPEPLEFELPPPGFLGVAAAIRSAVTSEGIVQGSFEEAPA